jgi:hypothetical protein
MDVRLDDAAITALLDDEHGMVGRYLQDLADQAAAVARARVPVRATPSWSARSNARPPGFTKASVHTRIGHRSGGSLWASANAPADPAVFLEYPREDRVKEPFLTVGLWSLIGRILWRPCCGLRRVNSNGHPR